MLHPIPRSRHFLSLGLACLSLALLAACGGPSRGGRGGPPPARLTPIPPLAGHGEFFDGTLLVELTTSAFSFKGREPGEERKSGGWPGGGGGIGLSGSFGPMRAGMSGAGPGGDRNGPGLERLDPEQQRIQNIRRGASLRPPVIIHLRITNRGPAPVTVSIVDFVSPLGNFAVRPAELVLDSGQSREAEPMASQLAGELAEVPVTLVVHVAGRKETKTIVLRAAPVAPAASAQNPG